MKYLFALVVFSFYHFLASATVWTVVNTNNAGSGSLRDRIALANNGDIIRFNPSLISSGSDSIVLSSDIVFSKSLTIKGLYNANDTLFISGGGVTRIFNITSTTNVKIDSLILVDGRNSNINFNQGGGAILFSSSDSLLILNSIIKNNSARRGGGVFSYNSVYCGLKNTKVVHNVATSNSTNDGTGGGLFMSSGILFLENSDVSNNQAAVDGGGIFTTNVEVEFLFSNIRENDKDGVVMYSVGSSQIKNSTFTNNLGRGIRAESVWNSNDSLEVNNCTFSGCLGGIRATVPNVLILNSFISGNTALDGGGVYSRVKKLWVENSVISDNTGGTIGGGIFVEDIGYTATYFVHIKNSVFKNNTAIYGGGIASQTYSSTAHMDILNTEIDSNQATDGGGVFFKPWGNGYLTMDSCEVKNNIVTNSGGGVYSGGLFALKNSKIVSNKSVSSGGGIYYYSAFQSLDLNNSTIALNRSNSDGGGIYASTDYANAEVNLIKSTISENHSDENGGGVFVASKSISSTMRSELNVSESSIVLNVADSSGGGVFLLSESNYGGAVSRTSIKNSTITGNTSLFGGSGIFSSANSITSNEYSLIILKSSIVGLNKLGDNMSNSLLPLFVSHGYNIFSDSALVDTVSTDQLGVDSTMLNLSGLSYNGGTTKTMMPMFPSVALNNGNPIDTTDAQNVPIVGVRDVGAAETCLASYAIDTVVGCTDYTWINGVTYTSSNNSDTYTLINAMGCDSIITLDLTLNSTYSTDTITACDSLTWINGETYYTSNITATDTLLNSVGCDSIVTLNLTIYHSSTYIDTITACDSLIWIDGNTYYANNSTAIDTLQDVNGCDSIVTLDLTIYHSSTYIDTIVACDSLTWIDGNTYYNDTNMVQVTLQNMNGCDSLVSLDLKIKDSPIIDLGVDTTIGLGASMNLNAGSGYQYTYLWNDGSTDSQLVVIPVSDTSVSVSVTTPDGCAGSDTINISILLGVDDENKFEAQVSIYPNPSYDEVNIDITGWNVGILNASILSVDGKIIENKELKVAKNKASVSFNTEMLKAGIYFIRIDDGINYSISKLVVK